MNRYCLVGVLALLALGRLRADEISLVRVGESWRYFPGVTEASSPASAWRQTDFDDSAWPQGPSGFSLAADEASVLVPPSGFSSVFFRKMFTVAHPQAVPWLVLRADYQDGFVAYLNGTEIARRGLTNDPAPFDALAAGHPRGAAEEINVSAFAGALVAGTNVLAIQLHAFTNRPDTLVLVPELLANFQRGPFVQNASATGIQVLWRTPVPADAVVEYGPGPTLGLAVSNAVPTTNHVLALTGLAPDTTYSYRVRSAAGGVEAVSPVFSFRTLKLAGDLAFAVFGDGGSGGVPQFQVARAVAQSGADLVLHVGDVIYEVFTFGLADTRCLSIYGPHMRSTPYFFTMGNHELYYGDAAYRETFSLPTNSATGTSHFYSFDHGDAHFVSLYVPTLFPFPPSAANGLAFGSTQYCWLTNDLAASAKPWKFLFFHSPLFDSGPHRFDDYDTNGVPDRIQLRQLLLPVAQQYGVQAIFSGHDHHYERFTPVNGVHTFVTGGGGGGVYPLIERDFFSSQFWMRYHFLNVAVHGDTLRVQAVGSDGAVFDEMTIQKAVPPPRVWPSAWHTPTLAAGPANDGDGNVTGQTFDFVGPPIPALTGEFSNLGEVFVNNDGTNLYVGLRSCLINADANVFLFVESPRLAGVTSLAGLGNGLVDPDGQGADGLDFLENLSFTNFAPALGCVLGDEFADGQFRSFQRPALSLNTGQGVFRLDASFSDVPGARVQQFDSSPQVSDPAHQGVPLEQNADFIEVAIPLAALGPPHRGDVLKLGAVVGGPGVDTNVTAQTRQLDAGFLGVALHGSGQGPVALEGVRVQLAAPLQLAIQTVAPNVFRLSWPTVVGTKYELEIADDRLTNFVAVVGAGFPRTATGDNDFYVDELTTNSPAPRSRAYRLRIAP